ncbi:flavodoxin family protein [Microbacterium enclense]|uniref:Multimeric flavodoxin WrbA n=1 Tax=Microbacterium enclense TaxID=993073 RepID=A0A1G6GLK8_9MICO|nr:flavodoxin family protein [Microbacterium enclense]KSU56344.1 flavodoxin [Microbacterium enclense]SDB82898.1 Multimeric flavodoxin WrbA [Microbacterium enclense]
MVTAVALNCTLKAGPAPSSTAKILTEVAAQLQSHGVATEIIRVVDYDVRPGVEKDMGEGDQWPVLREKLLAADILVFGTPTWMGHLSSVAARVLERLDAELSETDDQNRPILFGKVAVAAIIGNEDGAHKISADLFQALNDVGYSIPAQGVTYWNGEAMHSTDYNDLDDTPGQTAATNATVAANAAHLARLLQADNFPA